MNFLPTHKKHITITSDDDQNPQGICIIVTHNVFIHYKLHLYYCTGHYELITDGRVTGSTIASTSRILQFHYKAIAMFKFNVTHNTVIKVLVTDAINYNSATTSW